MSTYFPDALTEVKVILLDKSNVSKNLGGIIKYTPLKCMKTFPSRYIKYMYLKIPQTINCFKYYQIVLYKPVLAKLVFLTTIGKKVLGGGN